MSMLCFVKAVGLSYLIAGLIDQEHANTERRDAERLEKEAPADQKVNLQDLRTQIPQPP